jgi:NTP pyrophosphatase (non-canonical NTP hydrolase)
MLFREYQYLAHKTAIYPRVDVEEKNNVTGETMLRHLDLVYPALGYAGEAGEFANKVKKIIRDAHGDISDAVRADLQKELGDGLWYLAECATVLHIDLSVIAEENIKKLASRAERGVIGGSGDDR